MNHIIICVKKIKDVKIIISFNKLHIHNTQTFISGVTYKLQAIQKLRKKIEIIKLVSHYFWHSNIHTTILAEYLFTIFYINNKMIPY